MKIHEIMTPAPQVIVPGEPASLAAGPPRWWPKPSRKFQKRQPGDRAAY